MSDIPMDSCPQPGSAGYHSMGHNGRCIYCNVRTCNRHRDCDWADREFKRLYPNGKSVGYGVAYETDHCDDETCEDCFGY